MKQIPKKKTIIISTLTITIVGLVGFFVWRLFIYDPLTKPLTPIEEQSLAASTYFEQGKPDEAKKAYDKMIDLAETDEQKADVVEQKAIDCSTYGEHDCALDAVEMLEKFNVSKHRVAFLKADSLKAAGKQKQAKAEYKKALDLLEAKNSLTDGEKLMKQNAESHAK